MDFQVEDINVGKAFKQDSFSLHDGLAGERTDVAQAKHRGSVADDGYQVAARGEFEGIMGIFLDFEARDGDSRSVGKAEVTLRTAGLAGCNFNFSGTLPKMIIESLLFRNRHTSLRLRELGGFASALHRHFPPGKCAFPLFRRNACVGCDLDHVGVCSSAELRFVSYPQAFVYKGISTTKTLLPTGTNLR